KRRHVEKSNAVVIHPRANLFLFCSLLCAMQASMSHQASVRRRPPDPAPPPSPPPHAGEGREGGPAGGIAEAGTESRLDLGVTAEAGLARRRGRGAQTNASGRFEPKVAVPFDDGWQ